MGRKFILIVLLSLLPVITTFFIISNTFYVENTSEWKNPLITRSKKLDNFIDVTGEVTTFPFECETCALIGTSGHLLESNLGSEIDDNHSCVFRLGFSPTRGYGQHVGFRTTARIVDSFRFYPFLKKPSKLVTGPFTSEFWFLFDRSVGDITRFHGPLLSGLLQKHNSQFFWFDRHVEREIQNSLAKRYNVRGKEISSLWFATRIVENAQCKSLNIYGIPDSQICKKNLNISIPSIYWDAEYANICSNGIDASYRSNNSKARMSTLPTKLERKSLPKWAEKHFSEIHFKAPAWSF